MSTGKYYNPLYNREVNFDSIAFVQKERCKDGVGYKVYKDERSFILIVADTVAQAIAMSNIPHPVKIVRTSIGKKEFFAPDTLDNREDNTPNAYKGISTILPPPKTIPIAESLL